MNNSFVSYSHGCSGVKGFGEQKWYRGADWGGLGLEQDSGNKCVKRGFGDWGNLPNRMISDQIIQFSGEKFPFGKAGVWCVDPAIGLNGGLPGSPCSLKAAGRREGPGWLAAGV